VNFLGAAVAESYEVGELLGSGVFATVSCATGKRCGRLCALKIVNLRGARGQGALHREVAMQAELDHPHVARVYESFVDRSNLYIVLEYCGGGELFEVLQTVGGFFKEQHAKRIFAQISSAVRYLHSKYLAHRDLKLENCLLKQKDVPLSACHIKLIDFGLMAHFEPGSKSLKTVCGSPIYMAPEVHTHGYDEKCDVFSCGVMLFCMLCGRMPFNSGEQAPESVRFQPDDEASLTSEALWVLRRTCCRDPASRWSSAEVLECDWLRSDSSGCSLRHSISSEDVFENLRSYTSLSEVQRASLCHVAYNVDDGGLDDIRAAFVRMDVDHDGQITADDLRTLGREVLGCAEAQAMLERAGGGAGVMGYTEFLAAMLHLHDELPPTACRAAFRTIDSDDTGSVTVDQIKKSGSQSLLGLLLTGEEEVVHADAALSFEDFSAMLSVGGKAAQTLPI